MRIVVCDYSGHPFQVELSRCLAGRGHDVLHLHFAEFQTPKGALARQAGDPPGFAVEGVSLGRPFAKNRFLRRRFQEARIGRLIAARAALFRPDIVVGCNMPLDAQAKLRAASARIGAKFVFWLQDVYSDAISHYLTAKLGVLGRLVGAHYRNLEGGLLRSSDAVVAISEKFRAPLTRWGVDPAHVHVIPNWAPLSGIGPVAKDNGWARRHGLADRPVALYTGTLGLKHDPALLLGLARAGAPAGLSVVVVSEGPAVDWLERQKRELQVDNLVLLPFQPMELYPEVLGAGDIVLAMVGEEAAAFSVPSKILSYLAAGKPIVASIAADNDAALMIARAEAGFTAPPGDGDAFVARVATLAADAELRARMGRNARDFAEREFAIGPIVERFEGVLGARGVNVRLLPDARKSRPPK